jgi:hypothetical protein
MEDRDFPPTPIKGGRSPPMKLTLLTLSPLPICLISPFGLGLGGNLARPVEAEYDDTGRPSA